MYKIEFFFCNSKPFWSLSSLSINNKLMDKLPIGYVDETVHIHTKMYVKIVKILIPILTSPQ